MDDSRIQVRQLLLSRPELDRGFDKTCLVLRRVWTRLGEVRKHLGRTSIRGIGIVVLPQIKVAVADAPIRPRGFALELPVRAVLRGELVVETENTFEDCRIVRFTLRALRIHSRPRRRRLGTGRGKPIEDLLKALERKID